MPWSRGDYVRICLSKSTLVPKVESDQMAKKDLSDKLGILGKYCFIGAAALIVVYLLIPIILSFLFSNNVLGIRDVFGCDPSSDPCCFEPFNKTPAVSQNPKEIVRPVTNLCQQPRAWLSIIAMLLIIIGAAARILSWILKWRKKKK